jgi:putative colanic acid biosynthesis UDP-glucose lipid carrier transferase
VVLAWFFATPFVLLASHLAVRKVGSDPAKASEVRSVLIVGANDVGIKFARTIERYPNLFMQVRGFFEDRTEDRRPARFATSDAGQDVRCGRRMCAKTTSR